MPAQAGRGRHLSGINYTNGDKLDFTLYRLPAG